MVIYKYFQEELFLEPAIDLDGVLYRVAALLPLLKMRFKNDY